MNVTKHAKARSRQRGIPLENLDIILSFGTPIFKKGGATEFRLLKKDAKKLIQQFDKLIGKAVLVSEDGTIITTYTVCPKNKLYS
jgi:hypothetical protein